VYRMHRRSPDWDVSAVLSYRKNCLHRYRGRQQRIGFQPHDNGVTIEYVVRKWVRDGNSKKLLLFFTIARPVETTGPPYRWRCPVGFARAGGRDLLRSGQWRVV